MYASHARAVLNAKDGTEASLGIDDLTAKLRSSRPSQDEFVAAFVELRTTTGRSKAAPPRLMAVL